MQATGGNGKAGEIRLKVFTAMRIGLQIYLDLFRRAHAADESNCMPLPEFARQSFGITTIGPIWEILVMVAREDRSQGRSGRVDFVCDDLVLELTIACCLSLDRERRRPEEHGQDDRNHAENHVDIDRSGGGHLQLALVSPHDLDAPSF